MSIKDPLELLIESQKAIQEQITKLNTGQQSIQQSISELRQELNGDISELRHEMKGNMSELRHEIKGNISELRQEMKSDMSKLRHEMKNDISILRQEMKDGFRETHEGLDKQGKQLAYLKDDAPTREEYDGLTKRVEKIEKVLSS